MPLNDCLNELEQACMRGGFGFPSKKSAGCFALDLFICYLG